MTRKIDDIPQERTKLADRQSSYEDEHVVNRISKFGGKKILTLEARAKPYEQRALNKTPFSRICPDDRPGNS